MRNPLAKKINVCEHTHMEEVSEASRIVNELLNAPLTMRKLAALVPCSTGAIGMYASGQRGKFPSHRIMSRLLLLHKKIVQKRRAA